MRKFLLSLLVVVSIAPSCYAQTMTATNSEKQACMDFNLKIQQATDTLYTMASLWGTTFLDQFNGSQNYEELTPIRTDLQEYIDQTIITFKALPDVSGSQKLQGAMVALFEFEKSLMQNGFQPFEKLTPTSPETEINTCRDRLKEESGKEKSYLISLNDERKEYTTRNGIPLNPPPPPKPVVKPSKKKVAAQNNAAKPAIKPQASPAAQPQPAISEPVEKKPLKGEDDEDDDKNDKADKEDK